MRTNLQYITKRGHKRQGVMFDFFAATTFNNSLSIDDQEMIKDIYTFNGHAYYTTHAHTPHTFHYTDSNGSVSFDTAEEMERHLAMFAPVERVAYTAPEEPKSTFAILREGETELGPIAADVLYRFKYDKDENFYIFCGGQWIEETSTAFTFLSVSN